MCVAVMWGKLAEEYRMVTDTSIVTEDMLQLRDIVWGGIVAAETATLRVVVRLGV